MNHGYVYQLLRRLGLSTFTASTGEFLLVKPLRIGAIVLVAWAVGRLASNAIRRFLRSASARRPMRVATPSPRAEQRATTVGDVLGSLARAVIWSIAFLMILGEVGVNLAPLLAGAGIAGVAIGFGAQSLVKDFLSGLFILIEDQYGIGDMVSLDDVTGTVEDVTMRVTRMRALDGTVWFVPNGELRKIGNSSMEYSRAVVDIPVGFPDNVPEVTRLVATVAAALAEDPVWAEDLLEPPEVLGVHTVTATEGLVVRVVAKTAPRRQPAVGRELRARLSAALREAGVHPLHPLPIT